MQYFKRFGFDVVMEEWQLKKTYKIFQREKLEIQENKINLTEKMNRSWEGVGIADTTMGGYPAPRGYILIQS